MTAPKLQPEQREVDLIDPNFNPKDLFRTYRGAVDVEQQKAVSAFARGK